MKLLSSPAVYGLHSVFTPEDISRRLFLTASTSSFYSGNLSCLDDSSILITSVLESKRCITSRYRRRFDSSTVNRIILIERTHRIIDWDVNVRSWWILERENNYFELESPPDTRDVLEMPILLLNNRSDGTKLRFTRSHSMSVTGHQQVGKSPIQSNLSDTNRKKRIFDRLEAQRRRRRWKWAIKLFSMRSRKMFPSIQLITATTIGM